VQVLVVVGIERCLNPARELALAPVIAGMTLAVVAGFARS
jgi:hypothetical protein